MPYAASDPGSCFFMILSLHPYLLHPLSRWQALTFIDKRESCMRNSHHHLHRYKQVNRQTIPSARCFLLFHSFCYTAPIPSRTSFCFASGFCHFVSKHLSKTSLTESHQPISFSSTCHLGPHLFLFFFSPLHAFSQADHHHLNNNVKHTEDVQAFIFSSASVLNSRTTGRYNGQLNLEP